MLVMSKSSRSATGRAASGPTVAGIAGAPVDGTSAADELGGVADAVTEADGPAGPIEPSDPANGGAAELLTPDESESTDAAEEPDDGTVAIPPEDVAMAAD